MSFRPVWWAPTGVMQTLAGRGASAPRPAFRSEVWPTADDDELHVHFVDVDDAAAPVVLLLHGLEGSRESVYVAEAAAQARARRWRLCVLEFRSCGGVLNRARRTYHSGETGDPAAVAATLAARYPQAPLCVLGFSLGANVLLKWLGEVGDAAPAPLVAAVAISAPFDLAASAHRCDTTWGGLIPRSFLKTMIPKAIAKASQYPGIYDPDAVRRCRTFRAFDDLVTAPVHGFDDAMHYWRTQSCGPFLPAIRRPTLVVSALDDPLVDPAMIPRDVLARSPHLTAAICAHGGHVAFVDGGAPWRPRRWAEAQAFAFFAARLGSARFPVGQDAAVPR